MKILIIEDDNGLNKGITFALEQDGYDVCSAFDIKNAERFFLDEKPDALILDLNLPDGDGIEFCKKIRQNSDIPVLMLTARDMEVDEIMGLSSGADDYITKPFSVSVLKLRLEKIIQRKKADRIDSSDQEEQLCSGKVCLDTKGLRAYYEGKEIELSLTEFRLLQFFMENKNRVLLKEQILQHIWDQGGNFVEENTLSVNISRLRKKIGNESIKTIHGMGYLWEECV